MPPLQFNFSPLLGILGTQEIIILIILVAAIISTIALVNNKKNTNQTTTVESVSPNNSGLKRIILIGIMLIIGIGVYYAFTQVSAQREKQNIRNNILSYVTAETNNYQYSELGGIYNLVITIRNNTDYLLDNVRVEVTYIKKNGEVWQNVPFDFQMLPAQNVGTINVPNTSRGVRVICRIVSVRSMALGL